MFDQLFVSPRALARHRDGPLVEERRRYLAHCADQRMTRPTLTGIATYLLIVAESMRLADRPGERITAVEIVTHAERWADRPHRPPIMRSTHHARRRFIRYATRWLGFLGRLEPAAVTVRPHAADLAQFADFMREDRGLSCHTIAYRCRMTAEFLARMAAIGLRLNAIAIAQVDDLIARKIRDGGYSRTSARTYATALRAFFRYAERCGWCRAGLASAILLPRVYPHEGLPMGPSWEQVARVVATADGPTPTAVRDRALLLLLAVYGLRAGEVVGLRLDDFDWGRDVFVVRGGKGGGRRTYPISGPVGAAVLRYVRHVRPRSPHRQLFLALSAPIRPLSSNGLSHVVVRRLRGLGVPLPHYGPHALRHACATRLLGQGLSLKEIGDHLGHRSPESTRVYAKVDLTGLRAVGEFDLEGLA